MENGISDDNGWYLSILSGMSYSTTNHGLMYHTLYLNYSNKIIINERTWVDLTLTLLNSDC
jgi:hypothetical protein